MAQVTININGRHYAIGCADGEEDRLRGLASDLDGRMAELVSEVSQVGDARLLVMLGLLLLDELDEAKRQTQQSAAAVTDKAATAVDKLAARIEKLADALEVS